MFFKSPLPKSWRAESTVLIGTEIFPEPNVGAAGKKQISKFKGFNGLKPAVAISKLAAPSRSCTERKF
jgi:hypothetical protein